MATVDSEVFEGEVVADTLEGSATLMALNASEIDTQIATAKRYPRSLKTFRNEALEMATLTEEIAGECIYNLPRGGKSIEGPSARFAEIVASAWGNCRAGARVIGEDDRFVTAQGVFIDLQRNVAITYEVKRRITDKEGRTFKDDMIGVTSNAACSIALRNAVLKGVPKAFWRDIYAASKKTAIGDASTLATRRANMIEAFGKMGVTPDKIFALLEVSGEQDITLDHLGTLRGTFTAIKEGDTTIEQVFDAREQPGAKVGRSKVNDQLDLAAIEQAITTAPDEAAVRALYEKYVGPDSSLDTKGREAVSNWCDGRYEALKQDQAPVDAPSGGELFDKDPEAAAADV